MAPFLSSFGAALTTLKKATKAAFTDGDDSDEAEQSTSTNSQQRDHDKKKMMTRSTSSRHWRVLASVVQPISHHFDASETEAAHFWETNPDGIPIFALFGDQGGAGAIGRRIAQADDDDDGYLTKTEFRKAIEMAVHDANARRGLQLAILMVGAIALTLVATISGLTFAIVELSKETGVSEDGTYVDKNTKEAVKVASANFMPSDESTVQGAAMVLPGSSGNTAEQGGRLLATGEATVYATVSSSLPDAHFDKLKTITISSGGARAVIRINGYIRKMGPSVSSTSGADDSSFFFQENRPVTFLTPHGNFLLDGTWLEMLDDKAADLLRASGFPVPVGAGRRRKLLGAALDGAFNDKLVAAGWYQYTCYSAADWSAAFDSKSGGWSKCDNDQHYLVGLTRSGGVSSGDALQDRISNLDEGRCCRIDDALMSSVTFNGCQETRWTTSFDGAGWSTCPDNTYLQGLYRSGASILSRGASSTATTGGCGTVEAGLSCIDRASCCSHKDFLTHDCEDVDVSNRFDEASAVECPSGKVLTGLYRSTAKADSDQLSALDKIRCCKYTPAPPPPPPPPPPPSPPPSPPPPPPPPKAITASQRSSMTYKYYSNRLSYLGAKSFCENLGGLLAPLRDMNEYNTIWNAQKAARASQIWRAGQRCDIGFFRPDSQSTERQPEHAEADLFRPDSQSTERQPKHAEADLFRPDSQSTERQPEHAEADLFRPDSQSTEHRSTPPQQN